MMIGNMSWTTFPTAWRIHFEEAREFHHLQIIRFDNSYRLHMWLRELPECTIGLFPHSLHNFSQLASTSQFLHPCTFPCNLLLFITLKRRYYSSQSDESESDNIHPPLPCHLCIAYTTPSKKRWSAEIGCSPDPHLQGKKTQRNYL